MAIYLTDFAVRTFRDLERVGLRTFNYLRGLLILVLETPIFVLLGTM